ncbi:MAG: phospholipase, partial [Halobacteriovoraceae bacterium]|nr:phospholipase [Halobacteriovoraceae bacterium]
MKNLFLFILLFLAPLSLQAEEPVLHDYSTDGCSSYPDGNPLSDGYEWLHCCIVHDYAYWVGGTADERYAADAEMNACIAEASG